MKFTNIKLGQAGLSLAFCVLAVSCNPQEAYYPMEESITGAEDQYCSQAKDLNSCQLLAPVCQPAFEEGISHDESVYVEPTFSLCIGNPDVIADDGSTAGADDGSTAGSGDGSTAGSAGGSTAGSADGSTAGSAGGSTAGSGDGSAPVPAPAPEVPPTVGEAYGANCADLDEKYLWIKKTTTFNKKGSVSSEQTEYKVKVCHQTGNGDQHTIIIACPALKPHVSHHDDYLGACTI